VLGALLLALAAAGCGSDRDPPAASPASGHPAKATTPHRAKPAPRGPAQRLLGLPPVRKSPVPGYLMIADRNNNRILLVSPQKKVVWRFPGPAGPGASFSGPDDAFFTPGYRRIITNEEFNDAVAQIDPRSKRIVWQYGQPGVSGSVRGELSNPDDAYVLPNHDILIADIQNCRVLRLSPSRRILSEIGTTGVCAHDPPHTLLAPNGDTPLPGGGVLVTEIGGYIDRFDRHGRLMYSIRAPTTYPSDAQLLPNGRILVAEFVTPGRVDIITPRGRVVWSYGPASRPGSLDRPSLAVRWRNGMIAVTDDWHHRVVVIDPRTKRIVWQYGHFEAPSAAPGYLDKPDGLDLLPSASTNAPVRPQRSAPTKMSPAVALHVRRIGSLPSAASRVSAVALGGGRLLVAGGLVGGTSSTQVLAGPPSALHAIGRLPQPTHDAAAAKAGQFVYVFGGGQAVSTDRIERIDALTGRASAAGSIGEPLSDLGAAVVGGRPYLVGGYTGSLFATAVLHVSPGRSPTLATRLPTGTRYAGVAALGNSIYVAGGLTTAGESRAVYRVDPRAGTVTRFATLPQPVAHAPLAELGGALYLVGGTAANGTPLQGIERVDPHSGAVTRAGQLPRPLADAAAVTLGKQIVVLGGAGTAPSDAVLSLRP
jgi:DNA-binding beta-propeller fold protein YncE